MEKNFNKKLLLELDNLLFWISVKSNVCFVELSVNILPTKLVGGKMKLERVHDHKGGCEPILFTLQTCLLIIAQVLEGGGIASVITVSLKSLDY